MMSTSSSGSFHRSTRHNSNLDEYYALERPNVPRSPHRSARHNSNLEEYYAMERPKVQHSPPSTDSSVVSMAHFSDREQYYELERPNVPRSPPSYSVEADRSGNLVNKKYQVSVNRLIDASCLKYVLFLGLLAKATGEGQILEGCIDESAKWCGWRKYGCCCAA